MRSDEFLRFMAAWALVHETADEGWKAAVERGESGEATDAAPDFVDALSAVIAAEKDRLKAELAAGTERAASERDVVASLEALRFEVAELRGRIETLQVSVDAAAARDDD